MKHNKAYYVGLTALVLSWMTFPAFAAENVQGGGDNSVTTKDVVVQADRAKEEAKWESQSTTVITAEDIERKQGKSVEDVIFNEVGVTRTVDAMGKVGISIRGADPRHTLIMVDGQPVLGDVAKYNGNGDELMRIGAENIERIEIVRGAASAKYGSDAIGGVVNVITKKPKDTASVQLNAEGQYHTSRYGSSYESSALPSSYYLRADSGKIGKFSAAAWMSKRDILPVYSSEREYGGSSSNLWYEKFKPSLRYYGDVKNTGVSGTYEFNKDHSISFQFTSERDDLKRYNKSASDIGGVFEPMQIFNRNMDRDTYSFSYKGRGGNTDWQVDINHGKEKEKDVALLDYGEGTQYSGSRGLASVDWLEHQQTDVKLNMNTAINDKHLLSYGIGHSREWATGTRLKNAPKTHVETINPWDYDQSLKVTSNSASEEDTPRSYVHNYEFKNTEDGLIWDKDKEFYGDTKPAFTYADAQNMDTDLKNILEDRQSYDLSVGSDGKYISTLKDVDTLREKYGDIVDRYVAFSGELAKQNDLLKVAQSTGGSMDDIYSPAFSYYGIDRTQMKNILYNNSYYGKGYDDRDKQVTVGEAEINKTYAYVQDTWQVNDNTIVTPSLRLDHSDRFGSQVTGNLGMTHNLGGNAHRRLKANIGTGYAEPGMGELYYNWEMFSAAGSHLGWYWIGNPDLKPEKSVNFDVSIEGENNKTYTKLSLFHNEIKDYISSYFTGQLIDFGYNDVYNSDAASSYHPMPDRIYSFRNIGKAKITGIEAEVQQQFNKNWSAKLGYTFLHAINDSDKDLPHRLLDRPTHKVDIGINYKNNKGDFRGALWGSYYIHMLDSNSVSTESLFDKDSDGNYVRKQGEYQEKTFGIWNILLEKDFGKDFTAYVGVDNIFNHRDDDRAYQDRTYRFGINVKFDDLGKALFGPKTPKFDKDKDGNPIITNVYGESWFLSRPSDNAAKAGTVDVYGDYRLRENMFKGSDKTDMRQTKTTQPSDSAAKNHADKSGHGFEQRMRLGVNYQITDDMNLDVVGSTARRDTSYNVAEKRGLHDAYLEKAELNKKANKWDWTVGRIHEPMGVTGYWFGQEYDGIRAMYTDKKTQVVIGYGDFSQTTGVTDSAYNHKEEAILYRTPTLSELSGLYKINGARLPDIYKGLADNPDEQYNYRSKFDNAKTSEEKMQIVKEYLDILKNVDEQAKTQYTDYDGFYDELVNHILPTGENGLYQLSFNTLSISVKTDTGETLNLTNRTVLNGIIGQPTYGNATNILQGFSLDDCFDADKVKSRFKEILQQTGAVQYFDLSGNELANEDAAVNYVFDQYVGTTAAYNVDGKSLSKYKKGDQKDYNALSKVFSKSISGELYQYILNKQNNDTVPLPGAASCIAQQGYLLKQDKIPAMDRAAFVKIRRQVADNIGLEAWKLNSFGEGAYDANGREMRIADVLGLGAKIRLGSKSMLSFDYGQNHSDMGKYFHGGNAYGIYDGGSTPDFWVARLDVGIADTDVPGSWNAYFDYKSFDHGAFLGGTGADLPDRYLDGIRSFTAGFGYVPARNFLLEASYTFDAHSTQQRDTLYTPESFSLGDYTRVMLTYKF